jgi:hypothetical protein
MRGPWSDIDKDQAEAGTSVTSAVQLRIWKLVGLDDGEVGRFALEQADT